MDEKRVISKDEMEAMLRTKKENTEGSKGPKLTIYTKDQYGKNPIEGNSPKTVFEWEDRVAELRREYREGTYTYSSTEIDHMDKLVQAAKSGDGKFSDYYRLDTTEED